MEGAAAFPTDGGRGDGGRGDGGRTGSGPVLLACVSIVRAQVAKQEAQVLADVAHWAVVRTGETQLPFSGVPGVEREVRPGGSGTPVVAEFLPAELSAHLGLGPTAAASLLADALTLSHRMPRLLAALGAGVAEAWRVRMAAGTGRGLRREACERLDAYLATPRREGCRPPIASLTRAKLTHLLDQLALTAEEADTGGDAGDRATRQALAGRYVHLQHGLDGTAELHGRLSTADAERLDAHLDQAATTLAEHGGPGADQPHQIRRSIALGHLATTHTSSSGRGEVGKGATPVTLFVHLDQATGTFSMDSVGPITQSVAQMVLHEASTVTLTPVIDLATDLTYTGYAAPARLREQLALTQHDTCCFPWCDRPAWLDRRARTDYDHRIPHATGGPTSTRNGQLLCRFHHRVKTHGRWRSELLAPGKTRWTSPTGQHLLVHAGHTTPLRT